MTRQTLSSWMEWIRPAGIGAIVFWAYSIDGTDAARFHVLGPGITLLMCGTVAFESLFLGSAGSAKIGYAPNRAYQIQSGLANAAIALTAGLVYTLNWGRHADAAITTAMLLFFALSGANHFATAVLQKNFRPVNLLRPVLAAALAAFLVPWMVLALRA